jgi:hypothetical protein
MFQVFSTPAKLDIEKDFTHLGVLEDRHYYVLTAYMEGLFKRRMKLSDREAFFKELSSPGAEFPELLGLWLEVHFEKDVMHLTPGEVEDFLLYYENRTSPALFIELGKPDEDGGKCLGETLLLNSIVEIINMGRQ